MPKNKGLGRGLSALLGEDDVQNDEQMQGIKTVYINNLEPSIYQPRRVFDKDAINDLVESIRTKGVIQPLIVRVKNQEDDTYEIIGGERRWRASQLAGLTEVPVLVKEFTDKEALEVALIENLQRQDLNPLEEAEGYQRLMQEFSNTQEELSKTVGKSRSHIANTVRLLGLPQTIKSHLENGKLTSGHARALLTAKEPELLAEEIISKGLNVRQTEKLAQAGIEKKVVKKKVKQPSDTEQESALLAADLTRVLGLKVTLNQKSKGGDLILSYETLEQLDMLIKRLTNESSLNEIETKPVSDDEFSSENNSEDILEIDDSEIGDIIFDDRFDDTLNADVIQLEKQDEDTI